MFETFLADLAEDNEPLEIGSYIALIRRISNHVVYVKLEEIGIGNTSQVKVRWKERPCYRLDVSKNTVLALDCTTHHSQEMKKWYYIWEPHRLKLLKLCEQAKIKEKKNKRKLQWKPV